MEKNKILKTIGTFVAGLLIGYVIGKVPMYSQKVYNPNQFTSNVHYSYESYNNVIVSGTTVRGAINLLSDKAILIINKSSTDDNYAIVNNMTLWDEHYITKTEYGYWISKKSFEGLLVYDDIHQYYVTPMYSLTGIYDSNNTAFGTDEYIAPASQYRANLIKDWDGDILGVVFEIL